VKLVVGLTGGIGSGKSAVADEFAQLGVPVVDADAISRELTGPGGAAIPAVRKLFGAAFIDPSGAMDRGKVRERVFGDPVSRQQLEELLHPMIREESRRRIAAAPGPYVLHVVPLLVESRDYGARVDRVLVVDCPEELQVERVTRSRGLPQEQVRAIMRSQASRAERLAAADDVIDNGGAFDALRKKVAELHRRYLELAAGKRT
jgi:dephospho-CoA kinase